MTKFISHDSPDKNTTIQELQERDILLGRGSGVAQHIGNALFRAIIDDNRALYRQASKKEKGAISRRIISLLEQEGSRFVEAFHQDARGRSKHKSDTQDQVQYQVQYRLVSPKRSLVKVSQALRERKISNLRREKIRQALTDCLLVTSQQKNNATNGGTITQRTCKIPRHFPQAGVQNAINHPVVAPKTKKKNIRASKSAAETSLANRSTGTPPKPRHTRKTRAATLHAERAQRIRSLYQHSGLALAVNEVKRNESQMASHLNSADSLKYGVSSSPFARSRVANPESNYTHLTEEKSTVASDIAQISAYSISPASSTIDSFHGWASPPLMKESMNDSGLNVLDIRSASKFGSQFVQGSTISYPFHLGHSSPTTRSASSTSKHFLTPNSRLTIQHPCPQNHFPAERIGCGTGHDNGTMVTPTVYSSPVLKGAAFDLSQAYPLLPSGGPPIPDQSSLDTHIRNPNSYSSTLPKLANPMTPARNNISSNYCEGTRYPSFPAERTQVSKSANDGKHENCSLVAASSRSTPGSSIDPDICFLGQLEPSPLSHRRGRPPTTKVMCASEINANASESNSSSPLMIPHCHPGGLGVNLDTEFQPTEESSPIDIGQSKSKLPVKGSPQEELKYFFPEQNGLTDGGSIGDKLSPSKCSGDLKKQVPICNNDVEARISHLLRSSPQFEKSSTPCVHMMNTMDAFCAKTNTSYERLDQPKKSAAFKQSDQVASKKLSFLGDEFFHSAILSSLPCSPNIAPTLTCRKPLGSPSRKVSNGSLTSSR